MDGIDCQITAIFFNSTKRGTSVKILLMTPVSNAPFKITVSAHALCHNAFY